MDKKTLQHNLKHNLILTAGWKDVSLIDVPGEPSFVIWLCGCNLKCPFCHNYKIADCSNELCRYVDIEEIVSTLKRASRLVTTFHITGGEPLLQINNIERLLKLVRRELPDIIISINTNCTLPQHLELLLREGLVDHVATDIKIPFEVLSGLDSKDAKRLWISFTECLRLMSKYKVKVELRVLITKDLIEPQELVNKVHKLVINCSLRDYYLVVNPLKGPPHLSTRSNSWCSRYCNPSKNYVLSIAEELRMKGLNVLKVNT